MTKDEKGSASEPGESVEGTDKSPQSTETIDPQAEDVEAAGSREDGDTAGADEAVDRGPDADGGAPAEASEDGAREGTTEPVAQRTAPSELRGFFTHLAAGLVGGLIGVVGVGYGAGYLPLGELLGGKAEWSAAHTNLEQRIKGVEDRVAKPRAGADEALVKQVAALEKRTAGMEDAVKQVGALEKRTAGLEDEVKQVAALEKRTAEVEKATKAGEASATAKRNEQRIATLEDSFKSVGEAARATGDGGGALAAALTSRMVERAKKVDDRLSALEQARETAPAGADSEAFEALKTASAALEKRSSELAERIESLTQALAQVPEQRDAALAPLKGEFSSLAERIEGLKQALAKVPEQRDAALTALKGEFSSLAERIGGLKQALAQVPEQRDAALAALKGELSPLGDRVAKLEAGLGSLDKQQEQHAGERGAALAIAFADLKAAVDRGRSYTAELEDVQQLAPDDASLKALQKTAAAGVPTRAEVQRALPAAIRAAQDAVIEKPEDSIAEQLLHNARGLVTVRSAAPAARGDGKRVAVARVEARARAGDLAGAVAEAGKLKQPAQAALRPWLDVARARLAVDEAMEGLKSRLIRTLSGSGSEGAKR